MRNRPNSPRMSTLRFAAVVLAAVFTSMALQGCGAIATDAADGKNGPIKIGAALGETGLFELVEGEGLVGAQLAVDDINKKGGVLGRKLELVKGDTKSDPNLAPQVALELLDKGAEVLLTSDLTFGGPAARVANDHGVVAMSLQASPPEFGPAAIGPLAFSNGIATPNEAAIAAEWAYNEKGWRSIYELEDSSIDYTKSFHEYFRQVWDDLGGDIAGRDTFQNSDASIATQITRLKSLPKPPDAILMATYIPGGASALRQLRAAGIDTPVISSQPMDGTYWLKSVPNLSNFYLSAYTSPSGDDSDPFMKSLRDRFKATTGDYPLTGYYTAGYNAIDLLKRAIEKAGSTDGKKLQKVLESFDEETTPLGRTCFSAEIHVSLCRPFAIVQVQEGKASFVGRFDPKDVPEPRLNQ